MLSGFDKFANRFAEMNSMHLLDLYFDVKGESAFDTIQNAIHQVYFSITQIDISLSNYDKRQILWYQDFVNILIHLFKVRSAFCSVGEVLFNKKPTLSADVFLSKAHNEQYESVDDDVYFDFIYHMMLEPMNTRDLLDNKTILYPVYESMPAALYIYGYDADADIRLYRHLSDEDNVILIPVVVREFEYFLNRILFKFTAFRDRLNFIQTHKDVLLGKVSS